MYFHSLVGIGSNINVVDLNDFTSSESSSSPKVREELNCSIRDTILTASGMVHYYDSRRLHVTILSLILSTLQVNKFMKSLLICH